MLFRPWQGLIITARRPWNWRPGSAAPAFRVPLGRDLQHAKLGRRAGGRKTCHSRRRTSDGVPWPTPSLDKLSLRYKISTHTTNPPRESWIALAASEPIGDRLWVCWVLLKGAEVLRGMMSSPQKSACVIWTRRERRPTDMVQVERSRPLDLRPLVSGRFRLAQVPVRLRGPSGEFGPSQTAVGVEALPRAC